MGKVKEEKAEQIKEADILAALREDTDFFDKQACSWRVSVHEMRIKRCAKPGSGGWKTWKKFESASEMAAEWANIKRGAPTAKPAPIIIRECVEADKVLPPAGKMPPVDGLPCTPDALMEQYGKVKVATLEIIRFGAMLCDLDDALEKACAKAPNGRRGDESMRGWLETHCPEIKYVTAMGYKAMAADVRAFCKIPAKVPLALAMPGADGAARLPDGACPVPPSKLEKIQGDVWNLLDGKSARQLRLGLGEACAAPKGGARPKEKHTEEQKRELRMAAAKLWWTGTAADLQDQVTRLKSHMLLDAATLSALLIQLEPVVAAIKEAAAKGE